MSDVIISRRKTQGMQNKTHILATSTFTTNTVFTVPEAVNNEFSVRIFGGGGGGYSIWHSSTDWAAGGGGSGWMNNKMLVLPSGSQISITIGNGGLRGVNTAAKSGGTTSFGTYLSANGGQAGSNGKGGNGGAGGGCVSYDTSVGGTGYQFGGGGGGNNGGNGGTWGGGGSAIRDYGGGKGGTYGGGGGEHGSKGTYGGRAGSNGTNTIGWTNVELDLVKNTYITGRGRCMNPGNYWYGGGGFGGCGGSSYDSGGGGYGGNGGAEGGGGGGGYVGNGGNNYGGGGGYYGNGGIWGGGGGGYGNGGSRRNDEGDSSIDGEFGGGGAGGSDVPGFHGHIWGSNGGSGICIIQYYV